MLSIFKRMRVFLFVLLLAGFALAGEGWHFSAGLLTGREADLIATLGVRHESLVFKAEGFAYKEKKNDWWSYARATLAYRVLENLPFSYESGVSVGYLYARAPNKMHTAFNEAQGSSALWTYNEREYFDFSISLAVNLFGFQVALLLPMIYAEATHEPAPLWTAGYIYEF